MAKQERPIRGRVIAITGAARGIGRATAERLAAEGGRVAIGDLDADEAASVAATLEGEAIGLGLDVTDPASVAGFLDEVESRLGPLDVLVNNAGIMMVGPFADEDDAGTARELAVNVLGVVYGMRHGIKRMSRNGGGHIVNVASLASWFSTPGEATYSATKHAVRGLTESVRFELRHRPIELTSVYPGVVDTELAVGTGSGKLLQPNQIADAIADAIRRPRAEVFVPASTGPSPVSIRRCDRAPDRHSADCSRSARSPPTCKAASGPPMRAERPPAWRNRWTAERAVCSTPR